MYEVDGTQKSEDALKWGKWLRKKKQWIKIRKNLVRSKEKHAERLCNTCLSIWQF